ncbi:hypothetical protein Q5752_000865 [Cryptotrichosporon argae]
MAEPEVFVLELPDEVDEDTFDRLLFYLPDAAQARARRYHHASDRLRSLAAGLFATHYLSTHALLVPGTHPTLSRGPHGKPHLSTPALEPPLDFNNTHEGRYVVFAALRGRGGMVGVDVMVVPSTDEIDALKESLDAQFTADERAALAVPSALACQALTTLWTLKEAYTKAIGTGISFGLSRIAVDLGDGRTRAVRVDGAELRELGWGWATGRLEGAQWAVVWRDGDGQTSTGQGAGAGQGQREIVPAHVSWAQFTRTFIGSS